MENGGKCYYPKLILILMPLQRNHIFNRNLFENHPIQYRLNMAPPLQMHWQGRLMFSFLRYRMRE